MTRLQTFIARGWQQLGPRFLPFADAATKELPLGRLLRLSLFQVSVGMAVVLITGVLNRVMIVELSVPAWFVALAVALPLIFAPFRVLIGFRSDYHRSVLGWRRVPYIWTGTLIQFGGLSIMPFALMVLSGDNVISVPPIVGQSAAALAFLMVGIGLHMAQTAGLALATDLAPAESRPRVVALLYVMLLLGMVASALVFGALLADFNPVKLIKVIQGAAVVTMVFNVLALWQQEVRDPTRTDPALPRPDFAETWQGFVRQGRVLRLLVAIGLGTAAFSMQDILLEPYGGQILGLTVGATTVLTALLAGGTLLGLGLAARRLGRGAEPHRLAGWGAVCGLAAFALVILSAPLHSALLFRAGTALIGFGGGLFAVGTLTAMMALAQGAHSGIALGAWGAVQACCAGGAIALGGMLRDLVSELAAAGALGPVLTGPAVGYGAVYHIEIILLFATLVALGPLVRARDHGGASSKNRFGLAEFPG